MVTHPFLRLTKHIASWLTGCTMPPTTTSQAPVCLSEAHCEPRDEYWTPVTGHAHARQLCLRRLRKARRTPYPSTLLVLLDPSSPFTGLRVPGGELGAACGGLLRRRQRDAGGAAGRPGGVVQLEAVASGAGAAVAHAHPLARVEPAARGRCARGGRGTARGGRAGACALLPSCLVTALPWAIHALR